MGAQKGKFLNFRLVSHGLVLDHGLWLGRLFLEMILCGAQSDLPIHFTHHVLSRLTIVDKASLSIQLSDEAFPITLASQRFPLERVWLFYVELLIGTQR